MKIFFFYCYCINAWPIFSVVCDNTYLHTGLYNSMQHYVFEISNDKH